MEKMKDYKKIISALDDWKDAQENKYLLLESKYNDLKTKFFIEQEKVKILLKCMDKFKVPSIPQFEEKNGVLRVAVAPQEPIPEQEQVIQQKQKRTVYRSIKDADTDVVDTVKIQKAESNIQGIVHDHFSDTKEYILKEIENHYEHMNKHFSPFQISKVRKEHSKLVGKMPLEEYIVSINKQIGRIKQLCVKNLMEETKQEKTISNVLSPLDKRLVFYGKYFDENIEIDQISLFQMALKINIGHLKNTFVPYDRDKLFTRFSNYSIALFSILDIIEMNIVNPYGQSTFMHMLIPKKKRVSSRKKHIAEEPVNEIIVEQNTPSVNQAPVNQAPSDKPPANVNDVSADKPSTNVNDVSADKPSADRPSADKPSADKPSANVNEASAPSQNDDVEDEDMEDPFRFYILTKFDDEGKRCWKIDLRLQDFSLDLSNNIRTHGITLFRKIYFDVFGDNIYRSGFQKHAYALENDCSQLISNMFIVINHKDFCKKIQEIILKHSNMKATENDKINIKTDDSLHKKLFKELPNTLESEKKDLIQRLFDDIKDEEIDEFIRFRSEK